MGERQIDKEQTKNLFSECVSSMASMKVSFLYIIQPNSQHARPLWLFQLELSIDWLIVRPLFWAARPRKHIHLPEKPGVESRILCTGKKKKKKKKNPLSRPCRRRAAQLTRAR